MNDNRPSVKNEHLKQAIEKIGHFIGLKIKKHGDKAFFNKHHALGLLSEEYHEALEAIRNDKSDDFDKEMMDIVVVGLWWLASINTYQDEGKNEIL